MKERYTTVDILRAVAIIAMIIYHTLWDLVNVFGVEIDWFYSSWGQIFQMSIRWSFILISGFCWSLSRKNIKRGLIVLGGALVITVTTALFTPDSIITYGVLCLIGVAMIITKPLEKFFYKTPSCIGILVCILLFFVTYDIELGRFGAGRVVILEMPDFLYQNYFTAFFGFPPRNFFSSDYVPLLPWIFAYWIGFFIFKIFKEKKWLKYLTVIKCPPIEWIGRRSLLIYLIHQPIIYGFLYLIF